jgi:hypothetical protein
MEFISTADTAKRKKCSPQAVWGAIKRNALNAQQIGRSYVVAVDAKFDNWQPNPKIQAAGKARWKNEKA